LSGLASRTVFIDTSIYVQNKYDVGSPKFNTIQTLAAAGALELLTTDITNSEVESHISSDVDEAIGALNKAKKKAAVLRPLVGEEQVSGIFASLDADALASAIRDRFRAFLSTSGAETLEASAQPAGPVFESYFAGHAPFGPGKKKSEFPDAFVVSALEEKAKEQKQKALVVAQDPDFERTCEHSEHLVFVPSIRQLAELALQDEGLAVETAHIRFQRIADEIRGRVTDELEGRYMWLEDQDGEASEVRVSDLTLNPESVVSISEAQIIFSLQAHAWIDADISYLDPDSAVWDSETKTAIYFASVEASVYRDLEFPVEVTISYAAEDLEANDLEQVVVNNEDGFSIWADEDAETFYK